MAAVVARMGHLSTVSGIVEKPTKAVRCGIGLHFAEHFSGFMSGNTIHTLLVRATNGLI